MWHCIAPSSYCVRVPLDIQLYFSLPFNLSGLSKLTHGHLLYTLFFILTLTSFIDQIPWILYICQALCWTLVVSKTDSVPAFLVFTVQWEVRHSQKSGAPFHCISQSWPQFPLSLETSLPSTDFFLFSPPIVSPFISIHFKYINVVYFMCFILCHQLSGGLFSLVNMYSFSTKTPCSVWSRNGLEVST